MNSTIRSFHTTPAEYYIGSFTYQLLQKLDTWNDWKCGELSQLDTIKKLDYVLRKGLRNQMPEGGQPARVYSTCTIIKEEIE